MYDVLIKTTVYNVSLYITYHQMLLMLSAHCAQLLSHIVTYAIHIRVVLNAVRAFSYLQMQSHVNSVLNTFKTVSIVRINQHAFYVILSTLFKPANVKNAHQNYQDATLVRMQHIVQHV